MSKWMRWFNHQQKNRGVHQINAPSSEEPSAYWYHPKKNGVDAQKMDVFVQQMCVFSVDATALGFPQDGISMGSRGRWINKKWDATSTLDVKMLIKHTELRDPKALFSDQRRRFHVRRFHSQVCGNTYGNPQKDAEKVQFAIVEVPLGVDWSHWSVSYPGILPESPINQAVEVPTPAPCRPL